MLSEQALAILEFEKKWWRHSGSKENAIREEFGISATRYAQRLNQILDDPQALAHDPILVNRLKRVRSQRTTARRARNAMITSMQSERQRD
ncbi:DUF3263 domain-containing protein [Williamsia soli]|uniref:DUF3263 domain-containing protein n=1 Tax=Williamsia soli TaxID=364929 RepID=UPI001F327242|nr:DUF3263 domain-containing protein [Williamsia soli]